jgi:hypothetical protein
VKVNQKGRAARRDIYFRNQRVAICPVASNDQDIIDFQATDMKPLMDQMTRCRHHLIGDVEMPCKGESAGQAQDDHHGGQKTLYPLVGVPLGAITARLRRRCFAARTSRFTGFAE